MLLARARAINEIRTLPEIATTRRLRTISVVVTSFRPDYLPVSASEHDLPWR
jgi:hypothetical protein